MLSSLHIKNFAIIEEESVTFTEGFSALTGETGAGKSILLDALSLLLGERASVEMIRRGAPRATIEGHFHFAPPWIERVEGRLEALQLPPTKDEISLEIKRSINRSSANKLWINGAPARLTALRQLTEGLLEIVRQHESHQLHEPESHLGLLDRFAGLAEEAAQLSETVDRWKRLESEARRLTEQQAQDQARLERLEAQIARLERIAPEPGEDERVAQQLALLQAAEGLSIWVDGGLHELYARDGAILESIERLQQQLSSFIHVDPRLDAFHQALNRAHLELEELHHDLRRFRGEIPSDPEQIRELESRRDQLEALKDEFDATLEEIIEELDRSRAERDSLLAAGSQIKKLERDAAAHHRRAGVIARG
ncbi:MAG: AAA family ATPase, partial [Myxococcota bacterium]|nr:AAA family ATPase [Myxococcota bacterium]